jgi:hypothetical protein
MDQRFESEKILAGEAIARPVRERQVSVFYCIMNGNLRFCIGYQFWK